MFRTVFIALPVIALLSAGSTARAADLYFAQVATGSGSGQSTANCLSIASLNAWTNIAAGDTVHLVGTFKDGLNIGGGGTPGKPITIYFEPNAKFSAATWTAANAPVSSEGVPCIINGKSFGNIIIDGGVNGRLEATNNGNRFAFTNNLKGIFFQNANQLEIKNLFVQPTIFSEFSAAACTNAAFGPPGTEGIRITGTMNNISVHNCVVDMTGNGILIAFSSGVSSNVTVYSNVITHCSWGIGWLQSVSPSYVFNGSIWANTIKWGTNWNSAGSCNPNHGDGIILSCNTANGYSYGMKVYRNWLGPELGLASAYLYKEGTSSATNWVNAAIVNNVVQMDTANDYSPSFNIVGDGDLIANNTFISRPYWNTQYRVWVGGAGSVNYSATQAKAGFRQFNNYFQQLAIPWAACSPGYSYWVVGASDYNAYYTIANNGADWETFKFVSNTGTYTCSSVDIAGLARTVELHSIYNPMNVTNSLTRVPRLNNDFSPQSGSFLIGNGTNLTALFNALGVPADDIRGTPRPATGPWTIGAFETPVNRPSAPTAYPPTPVGQ